MPIAANRSRPSRQPSAQSRDRRVLPLFAAAGLALQIGAALTTGAHAGAGTAVPPLPGGGTIPSLWVAPPPIGPVTVTTAPGQLQGFTTVGFLQQATVSDEKCPGLPRQQQGGTATVNGITIIIPCNSIVQMPASTFPWSSLIDTPAAPGGTQPPPLALRAGLTGGTATGSGFTLPSTEITIVGNIVSGVHIAGLVFISQQSLNSGVGTITGFDHARGVVYLAPRDGGGRVIELQINDSRGRFTAGQSIDPRFNVDDENPTIRAVTGYPMCIPRKAPDQGDDPRCPQRNRPLAPQCRNFAAAGVALPSGQELPAPRPGQVFCSAFVMGHPASAGPGDPTAAEQAPLQIGDVVVYSGTLHRADTGSSLDVISVHTLEANVGIFTEPGTLPAYIAIGGARISADGQLSFNGVPQEAPDRVVFDAMTTDVLSIVDLYLIDIDPATGRESQRWVTPFAMTGGAGGFGASGVFVDGGITTQFAGPVPGRVRMRAGRATPGLLVSPTRYVRAVLRSLCDPSNVNGTAPPLALAASAAPAPDVPCLERAIAANGLRSGQFLAPMAEFLFPEALIPGDPTAPNTLWTLGFLVNGEGAGVTGSTGTSAAGLVPTPW